MITELNYDPDKHFELILDTAAGNPPTEAELKTLLDNGIISEDEYKYHSQSDEDKQLRADIDAHIRTQQSNIKSSLAGNHDSPNALSAQDLKGAFGTEFNNRAEYLKNDIAEALMVMAQSDPSILTDPRKMQAAQEQAMQAILQRPEYRMTNDQQNGWSFNADANPQVNMTAVTAVDGNQDFSKLTADQLFNQSGIPLAQMNPTEDRFFSKDVFRVETDKYLTHGYVSQRAKDIAAKLGITPKALLDAQNARYGLPSLDVLRQETEVAAPSATANGTDIPNVQTGFKHLQRSLDFPPRGAAYIASAIDHESAWNGMREWGQVAGDGTNRNGGLISWASWSNDSARLGAIERYFGKPISQILRPNSLST